MRMRQPPRRDRRIFSWATSEANAPGVALVAVDGAFVLEWPATVSVCTSWTSKSSVSAGRSRRLTIPWRFCSIDGWDELANKGDDEGNEQLRWMEMVYRSLLNSYETWHVAAKTGVWDQSSLCEGSPSGLISLVLDACDTGGEDDSGWSKVARRSPSECNDGWAPYESCSADDVGGPCLSPSLFQVAIFCKVERRSRSAWGSWASCIMPRPIS